MNTTIKIKPVILFLAAWLCSILGQSPYLVACEKEKKGVVKILAYKGGAEEKGAGIILSKKHQPIYIMTAYHVIEGADSILVEFYENPTQKFRAKPFNRIDVNRDLAAIYIENTSLPKTGSLLCLGNPDKIKELDKVFAVGHPDSKDWICSSGNVLATTLEQITFSGDAVNRGNSGGALLNKSDQLIGMPILKGSHGIALKIDVALKILEEWKIHHELNGCCRKWPWILGIGTVTSAAVALLIWHPWDNGLPEPPEFPTR